MTAHLASMIGRHELARSNAPVLFGLALPLAYAVVAETGLVLGRFALMTLVILGWQLLFRKVRGQEFGLEGVATALLLALMVPLSAPYWQLVLGASFGIVIGLLIFGGPGRNFLHPALVALAFLMFSFTDTNYRAGPDIPLWSILPALPMLIVSGQVSWRIVATAAIGMALVSFGSGSEEPLAPLLQGSIWLALLFLLADPVASSATQWGRPVCGLLAGVLGGLFMQAGAAFGATVFAILLTGVFAPLIDQCVIAVHVRNRERRHG